MNQFSTCKKVCAILLIGAATVIRSQAQTLTTLVNFNGTNGDKPQYGSLINGADGSLYGTTYQGGTNNLGTFFKMTTGGALTTLYNGVDSSLWRDTKPTSSLLQANDGNFYGTTEVGGLNNCGSVFRVTPAGVATTIYNFCYTNGAFDSYAPSTPYGGLIQGADGYLYGTSSAGGATLAGAVYRVSLAGVQSTIHSFAVEYVNGNQPVAGLVQGTDGNLYGTTTGGGANFSGTIFRVSPGGGGFTTLHSFDSFTDGRFIDSGLIQGTDGNFYGTTSHGGAALNGTVYKMTPSGTVTVLHSFSAAGTEGIAPDYVQLVQATDGNFYGTTSLGGANGYGTVFKITPAGVLTSLYSFDVSDGQTPEGGLVQGADGSLYGTTSAGGANFHGTIFKLTLAAGTTPPGGPTPAVTGIVSDASFKAGGPVASGSWVAIFGTSLAPAGDSRQWNPATEIVNGKLPTSLDGTSVTMNGKAAAVAFISPTQVNIQAPDDTAIGPVQVVVSTVAGAGTSFTANYAQSAPGLFPASGSYIAAQHSNGTYVGGYAGATPATPGEVIVLWGSGFGPASPAVPAGQVFAGANKLANPATVTIGGQPAVVDFAGVVGAGLVQINVHVPSSINNGDAAVVATVGGVSTQATGNMISVGAPAGASAVIPSLVPNPVYQQATDANGYSWFFTVKLTETAGTATTLTGFTYTVQGFAVQDLSSSIAALFGSAAIPAKGTLSAPLRTQLTAPGNVIFGFTGMDANGTKWTQQIIVPFNGPQ